MAVLALNIGNFKVGGNLLKRQLKGIADVMEQGRQAPVLQVMAGSCVVVRQAVVRFVGIAVNRVGLVNGQPQGKHIHRVGIVVAVLHQQAAAVVLIFREQLDHAAGLFVIAHKHVQIAEVDVKSVLFFAAAQKAPQGIFQAQAVNVLFHVAGDLVGRAACAFTVILLAGVKAQPLAAAADKRQRCTRQGIFGEIQPRQTALL